MIGADFTSVSGAPKPDRFYLAYRCQRCMRLITKLEMLEWRAAAGGRGRGNVCLCGGGRISPTNLLPEERGLWRVRRLRLAVFASPPYETFLQRLFGPLLLWAGVPWINPPPPPPTEEEVDFANHAKLAIDERIAEVAKRLADDDLPLEEALVRHDDSEVAR